MTPRGLPRDVTAVASAPRNMQVNLATEGAAQAGATSTPATLREALQEALTATLRAQPDDPLAYFADCLVHKPSSTYAEAVLPRLEAALSSGIDEAMRAASLDESFDGDASRRGERRSEACGGWACRGCSQRSPRGRTCGDLSS